MPGFGDPKARVLIVGLAPAAHGGNRTGRMFTGDRSGEFLFPALYAAGFANQPTSVGPGDGLELRNLFVSAVNRCAPPDNKPTPEERDNCLPYLIAELRELRQVRVIVCLGAYAWDGVIRALAAGGPRRAAATKLWPRRGGARWTSTRCSASYHPSQQNTFTGKLTPAMMRAVFERARDLAGCRRLAALMF